MPCHHPFGFSAGGHSTSLGLCPTKLPVKWDIQLLKVYLALLVAALFVLLVLSGNVFAARRKPSECKPNLHPLETHQLYSRLISCARKISTLHLEFKCVCVCCFSKLVPSSPLTTIEIQVREEYPVKKKSCRVQTKFKFTRLQFLAHFKNQLEKIAFVMAK